MKKQIVYLVLLVASAIGFGSCGNNSTAQNRVVVTHAAPQNVSVETNDIPGFDVNQFAELLKTTSNPDALTQAINKPGNTVNNLDLDNDGNIDYLKVDQTSNNSLGVFDETPNGKVTIATLTVNAQNNSYAINGAPDYCGNTCVYHSQPGITLGQYMFLSWMLRPHPYYHPYWGYNRGFSRGYSSYRSHYRTPYNRSYMHTRTTRTVVKNPTSNSSQVRQSTRPSTPSAQRSLSNPTQSQRSFSKNEGNRFDNRGANTSGFGGSSTRQSTQPPRQSARPSTPRSFGSSGGRSFGDRSSGSSRSSGSRSSGGRRR